MLASSAFVLAALTMTGVYMKGQNVESKDDGYTLDFTALENNADDKMQEISEYNEEHLLKEEENIPELTANNTAGNEIAAAPVTEDDLDYLPGGGLRPCGDPGTDRSGDLTGGCGGRAADAGADSRENPAFYGKRWNAETGTE